METPMELDNEERRQSKRKIDDGVVASSKKRNIKGILLSLNKPCYTLKRGIGRELRSLRGEHRNRLRYLLRQLDRRQNSVEASGVLSLLLKATHKWRCSLFNRTKYSATLELLEHMKAADLNPTTVPEVYILWMKKDFSDTKNKRSLKARLDVLLELLLFFLSQGATDKAHDAVTSLQQKSDFSRDPIANLVVGLAFSHQWYNAIKKELCLHDSLESGSLIQSGPQEIKLTGHHNGQSAVGSQDSGSAFRPDSSSSIRIDKVDRKVLVEVDHEVKKEIPEYEEVQMTSDGSDLNGNSLQFLHTGNKVYESIVFAQDVEYLLMPITFPRTKTLEDFIFLQRRIQNDHYKAAVKHLQNALHSTPPAFQALLPLIQMLVFGDQVKEAIEEVENVVQNSHAALPFRLKASLLEHFSKEDANNLAICFEDTLRKDPTCSHSLAKLISLHQVGDYSIEGLVEMIALHLDATYANCDIWKQFASCLIMLYQCDEDRMSSCANSYGDSYTKFSKNIHDMFQNNISRKNWRLRCRWWRTRHFTQTMLASEITSGKLELVAYKAAAACHLYGSEFAYVVTARRYLIERKVEKY